MASSRSETEKKYKIRLDYFIVSENKEGLKELYPFSQRDVETSLKLSH
jgi:hypothetical protein